MTHTHLEIHALFSDYWIPHTTLLRVDEEGDHWECPFCGCPHKAMVIDGDTVSFVALESRECWKSFEEACPECGETYQCVPGCQGKGDIHEVLADLMAEDSFEEEEEEDYESELLQIEGGLPMWGGPFEA